MTVLLMEDGVNGVNTVNVVRRVKEDFKQDIDYVITQQHQEVVDIVKEMDIKVEIVEVTKNAQVAFIVYTHIWKLIYFFF